MDVNSLAAGESAVLPDGSIITRRFNGGFRIRGLGESATEEAAEDSVQESAMVDMPLAENVSDEDAEAELSRLLADADDDTVSDLGGAADAYLDDMDEASRFDTLVAKLRAKGARDPRALAAYIGRKKYGKAGFAALAKAGRRKKKESAAPGRVTLTEATAPGSMRPTGNRRYRARIIEGDRWGASGYYSAEVLRRDAAVFGPGTLMYFDHPTPTEESERPERSVRDLAAKIVSTPRYEGDGLYADIEVFAHAAPIVEALADSIGLSIRAAGTAEYGEAAGREGMIITGLTEGYSVDFVTQAGAGGRLVSLLESARHTALREARTIGAWLESRLHLTLTQLADDMYGDGRLSRDERIALSNAIGDGLKAYTARIEAAAPQLFERDLYDEPADRAARMREATTEDIRRTLEHLLRRSYGGGDRYLYVYDYDAARGLVWYEVGGPGGEPACWQQSYSRGEDGALVLGADRVRAERRTIYVPVEGEGDGRGPVYESAETSTTNEDVTDSTPLAAPTNPSEEEPVMSGTQTGASPGTAGTATVAETANTNLSAEARAQIAEAALREAQAQITALQAEKTSLVVERDTALGEVRRLRAQEAARGACEAALRESDLPAPTVRRITESVTASVPLTDAGEVNTAALSEAITAQVEAERAYIASIREAAGEGTPTGLGASAAPADMAQYKDDLAAKMRRLGLSEAAARAAAGR